MVATSAASSDRAAPPEVARVVAAVLWVDDEGLVATLDAVGRQVYEVAEIVVVGGPDRPPGGPRRAASFSTFVAELGPEVDLVWVLHGDARPRPDALGALVDESERNSASLVGSKVLDASDPSKLESVGTATDAFGEPYSGLDPGEVDLEQYDVIRDVAFVAGVSLLVRRDLLKGLRGLDPLLPPVAAGMDLSQRARIAGSRVMVVPSSEVLHARRCGHDVATWRELAGRQRAMLKAYRWVSLLWVVPVGTVVAIVDGFLRLAMGKPRPLLDFARSVVWNAIHLPSLVTSRRALDRVRASRDEELFRYQIAGSLRLRSLVADLGERLGLTVDAEPGREEETPEEEVRLVGPIVAALVLLVVGLATRRLWLGGPPASGFSLPASSEVLSVLRSWAGGWNAAGLGSPEPLHPSAAGVAAVQAMLGGWSGAQGVIAAGSTALGVLGAGRLLARVGVVGPSRHLAGAVLMLGPFAGRLGAGSSWAGLVALGGLPWMVDAVIAPWPPGWRRRTGRVGVIVVASALTAAGAPLAVLVAPSAALLAWALVPTVGRGAVLRGLMAAALGAVLVSPYLLAVSWDRLSAGGPHIDLRLSAVAGILLLVAALAATLFAPLPHRAVAGWGGVMAAVAAGAAAVPDAGGEVAVALAALGSLGAAMVVGAALPVGSGGAVATTAGAVSSAACVGLLVLAVAAVPAGRGWLPADEWSGTLDFAASLAPPSGPDRVLIIGSPESLPGESRLGPGFAYRLVWGAAPTLDQAWLNRPLPGDEALALAIDEAQLAGSVRPGEILAPFAIRWLVVLDGAPVTAMLDAQVDLAEIPVSPGVRVFENLAARPRADAPSWTSERVEASGPPVESVRLADNADPGWRPGGRAEGWFTVLDGSGGEIGYRPDPLRLGAAWLSLAVLVAGIAAALWGRERR